MATELRICRELQERRMRTRLPLVVVELDGGNEDVPDPQSIGEHPRRHETAAGDRQHQIERRSGQSVGQSGDEPVELVPGHDVPVRGRRLHRHRIRPGQLTYSREPGVVSNAPVSSQVFSPDRIIGQPPYSCSFAPSRNWSWVTVR